jgi:AcrR family transcriptional regulator
MPRKIPDVETKILETASKHFIQKGYLEVNMRDIATEAGTSVGTLYNYYATKKALFIAGRQIWMKAFHEQTRMEIRVDEDPWVFLENLLFKLMEGLSHWAGLYDEFMTSAKRELDREDLDTLQCQLKDDLFDLVVGPIDRLLGVVAEKTGTSITLLNHDGHRAGLALVSLIKTLVRFYPDEGEKNRAFLKQVLNDMFRGAQRPVQLSKSV